MQNIDLIQLLYAVTAVVQEASDVLVKEWERDGGPRGEGNKAEVDTEIEVLLRKRFAPSAGC